MGLVYASARGGYPMSSSGACFGGLACLEQRSKRERLLSATGAGHFEEVLDDMEAEGLEMPPAVDAARK